MLDALSGPVGRVTVVEPGTDVAGEIRKVARARD